MNVCRASELVERTGRCLGQKLADELFKVTFNVSTREQICIAFGLLFQSMECLYSTDIKPNNIIFSLDECPLTVSAHKTGVLSAVELARRYFIALCTGMLTMLVPQWTMIDPDISWADYPLKKIILCN